MAMAAQVMGLGPEGKDVSLLIEKISDKILIPLNERFDKLEATLQAIQTTQEDLSERVETIEGLASDYETQILSLETSLDNLRKENKLLKFKINDLEGRLRCNNISIIGIPEGNFTGALKRHTLIKPLPRPSESI